MLITPHEATRERVVAISEALSLDPSHYDIVLATRDRNPALPALAYHSPEHCAWVASAYVDLAGGIVSEDLLRHGFLAALYHDAAHPGLDDDDLNVTAAAEYYTLNAPHDAGIDRALVREMILSTSSGSLGQKRATHGAMRLLHDADLLQTVVGSAENRTEWRRRLSEETGLVTDERLSNEYVRERLLTVPAHRVLDRFSPNRAVAYTVAKAAKAEGESA